MTDVIAAVHVRGNRPGTRIGLVKWYEMGYYPSKLDSAGYSTDQIEQEIREFNMEHGIPEEVAESAEAGSMFGWHVPAAQLATEFYKNLVRREVI